MDAYRLFMQDALDRQDGRCDQESIMKGTWILKEKKYVPCPEGTQTGRISGVFNVGRQPDKGFGASRKWIFEVEVSSALREDGSRFRLTKWMQESIFRKANMRKAIEAALGRSLTEAEAAGFDIRTILGKPCLVTVVHKDGENGINANIEGFAALPAGMTAPELMAKPIAYNFEADGRSIPDEVPEFIQKAIKESAEWNRPAAAKPEEDDNPFDDDIPSTVEGDREPAF